MKRIISVTAVLVLLCTLLCSCDISDITGGSLKITYKSDGDGLTVTAVPDNATVPEIVIPDEHDGKPVTAIADFAMVNLENITKITIGKNVREIGLWALENNKKVFAIEVDDENEYFCDADGVLFTKDMKTLLFYPMARNAVDTTDENGNKIKSISYAIPEGVETVRTKAFYKCSDIRELTLPSTLKIIEEKSFFRCSISEILLPEGLEEIGKDAFAYTGLKTIDIPASVKTVGEYAFYNCTSLLEINVGSPEEELTLGDKWYPTNNGLNISELVISWAS